MQPYHSSGKPTSMVLFFILAGLLVLVSPGKLLAQVTVPFKGEIVKIISLPDCPANVTGMLLYTEADKKGDTLQIFCNRQYQARFKHADGRIVWVGKCPFSRGHNTFYKKVDVNGTITIQPNGQIVADLATFSDDSITLTFWKSVHPVGDPPAAGEEGPVGTGEDKLWIYQPAKDTIAKQKTKHTGRWRKINGIWVWIVDSQVADGPPSFDKGPGTAVLLSFADAPDTPDTTGHVFYAPTDFVTYTPVPVTAMQDGKAHTFILKQPVNSETLVTERIEAVADSSFMFDIKMPHEEEKALTYSLITAPENMTIDPGTGIINWLPGQSQIGDHKVRVRMTYYKFNPVEDEFILTVKSQEKTKKGISSWLLIGGVVAVIVILLLVFRKRK